MDFLQGKKKGFTVVELVIVILVMGILMSVVVSRFGFLSDKANETGMKSDFRAFQTASESAIAEYSFKTMNTANVEDRLNSYLDQSLIFKDGYSVKENPWGFQYMLNIEKTSADGSSGKLIFLSPKSTDASGNQTGHKLVVSVESGAISTAIEAMQAGESVLDPNDGTVTGIFVSRNPTKMTYYAGESFSKAGMIVKTRHADGSMNETSDYTISDGTNLTVGAKVLTITYTADPSKTTTVTINVLPKQDGSGTGTGGGSGTGTGTGDGGSGSGTGTGTGDGGGVQTKTLSVIQLTNLPNKTQYTAGEQFNPAGMVITAFYSDGSTANVTSSCQWNTSALVTGQSVVPVSYTQGGITKSASVYITVTAPSSGGGGSGTGGGTGTGAGGSQQPAQKTLQGIYVSKPPSKTQYNAGDSFMTAGMEVTLAYSDGSSDVVTSGFTHDGYRLQAGTSYVTISYTYNGVTKSATTPVTVSKILTGISVSKQPTKQEYTAGEAFQSSGMMVTAFYSDGSSAVVTDYKLPSNLITVKGMNTFTISYTEGGVTKTADVNVYAAESGSTVEKKLTSVSVDSSSTPVTKYYVGDNFNPNGLYLSVQYNDGTTNRTTSFNVDNGFNLQKGTYPLTLRYADEYGSGSTTLTVTVTEKPAAVLTRLAVTTDPVKTTYFVGENFDPTGMALTAYYDDPALAGVMVPLNQVTYVGDKNLDKTSQVVLVKYTTSQGNELSTSVRIKMYGSLTGVTLKTPSSKTNYAIGETYDLTGVKLTATFDDGTTQDVTPTAITPSSFTSAGEVEVLLSYEHNKIIKSASTKVNVRGVLSKIEITTPPDKKEYREGFNFDKTGMVVKAYYGSGSSESVETITNYEVVDGNNLALGTTRIVLKYTYGGKTVSTSQPIVVYPKIQKPIAAGNDTTFFIDENEDVYGCGLNTKGQLGVGATANSGLFRQVNLDGVRQIVPARYSEQTFFLLSDGTVKASGANKDGRLGVGNTTDQSSPATVKLPAGTFVSKVCAGNNYTLFLTNNNKVYVTGAAANGAGGAATSTQRSTPAEIIAFSIMDEKVVDIECTGDNSFYILSNGDVYACGTNATANLGLGDKVAVAYPLKVEGLPPVKEIVMSDTHTLFVTEDNQIYVAGQNSSGELGLGHTKDALVPTKSIMLTLAYNYSADEKSEIFVNSKNTMMYKPDKTLYAIGATDGNGAGSSSHYGSSGLAKLSTTGYDKLAFGKDHCLITKTDKKLYTYSSANNSNGELARGLNTIGFRDSVLLAYDFDEIQNYVLLDGVSYIRMKSGNAYVCGADRYQKARLGRATGAVNEIAEIADSSDRAKINKAVRGIIPHGSRYGNDYVCYEDGSTDVIGRNYYFTAGDSYSTSYDYVLPSLYQAGTATDIVYVDSQLYGAFAVSKNGSVYSCGTSKCLGDTTSQYNSSTSWYPTSYTYATRNFVAIGSNMVGFSAYNQQNEYYYNYALGVNKTGVLSVWGNPYNNYPATNSYYGNSLWAKDKVIASVSGVKDVVTGWQGSVILMNDGTAKYSGQIYNPGTSNVAKRQTSYTTISGISGVTKIEEYSDSRGISNYCEYTVGLKDGKLINVAGNNLPSALKSFSNIKDFQIMYGERWFFQMNDGSLYAYGDNTNGCLGIGTTSNPSSPQKVKINEKVVEIYTDPDYHITVFVGESGTEYLAGNPANGRIPGKTTNQSTPIAKTVLKLAS